MRKNLMVTVLGFFLLLFPLSDVYSQGLCEYGQSGNTMQEIYIPATFNILDSNLGQPQVTETRLIIRNTDPSNSIHLSSVYLYDPSGNVIKNYTPLPIVVSPFSSTVSFSTPDTNSGINRYSESAGKPFFLIILFKPPGSTNPILEAERNVLNINRVGNTAVQSVALTHGTVIFEMTCP